MRTLPIALRALVVMGPLLLVYGLATSAGCASKADDGGNLVGNGAGDTVTSGSGSVVGTSAGGAAPSAASSSTGLGFGVGGQGFAVGSGGGGGGLDCGRENFDVARKPVDILLVLDRSASMEDDPSGGSSKPSKWDIVVPALEQSITATDAAISWGLKVFPEGNKAGACTTASFPADILVPIAANNAVTVDTAITATTDQGDGTPTGDAIKNAVTYLSSLQNDHVKYLLLATDGDPSCPSGDAADALALQSVTDAATAGYHTFVVGVASQASKIKSLNTLAVAGLEPRVDPDPTAPQFYLASTQADLVTVLEGITGAAASCLFPLSSAPPNPDHVGVSIAGTPVPKDTTDTSGWDYTGADMMTIALFGAACEEVKSQGASTVAVVFGCMNDPLY